jgi:hypothetical protein
MTLRAIKEKRQVIIVTHNANIAGLGDAELLLPMCRENDSGRPRTGGQRRPSSTLSLWLKDCLPQFPQLHRRLWSMSIGVAGRNYTRLPASAAS